MNDNLDYSAIAQLPSFKKMQRSRMVFTIPITFAFMAFYLGLPLLAGFTKVLTKPFLGSAWLTWAWVYAFAQFLMTWGLCMWYLFRANGFDAQNKIVLADLEKLPALGEDYRVYKDSDPEPAGPADDIKD